MSGTVLGDRDKTVKKIDGQETALMKLERLTKQINKVRENRQWPNTL